MECAIFLCHIQVIMLNPFLHLEEFIIFDWGFFVVLSKGGSCLHANATITWTRDLCNCIAGVALDI